MSAGAVEPSLAVRTAKGAGWIIVWRMSTRVMGVISTVIMVRLLPPADFGLVALATSFAVAVDWISGIGVNDALVRERKLDRPLYDTGFTMNAMRGALMGIAIAAGALPVATFFGDPRLANILFVLAVTMFIASIENIGVVDFRRSLAFHMEFRLSVVPRIGGIAASLGYAAIYGDYWALIAGITTNRLLRVVLTYWMHPYRPRFALSAWRRLVAFSVFAWLSGVATLVRDRIDTVVIGRMLGPTSVGVYSVGWEIGSLTSTELVEPVTAALFAGFAEAGRTGTGVGEGYFKAISATLLLTLPMGFGLSLLADPIIRVAFGEAWLAAVPLIQIFALVCMLKVVASFSAVLLTAQGHYPVQFKIIAASVFVRVGLLAVLVVPYGLVGAALAAMGSIALEEALFLIVTFRRFNLRAGDLIRGTWRCAVATAAMAAMLVLFGVGWHTTAGTAMELLGPLIGDIFVGAATYAATLVGLWWLAGRPQGAESIFIELIIRTAKQLRTARLSSG